MRNPGLVPERSRPARVKQVVFPVIALHRRAAPDIEIRVGILGRRRDGLEHGVKVVFNDVRRSTSRKGNCQPKTKGAKDKSFA
jgi:hypothetical protein